MLLKINTGKIDLNENVKFSNYFRSKLLTLPMILLIQYGVYISILSIALLILIPTNISQIDLVVIWSVIAFLTHFPFTFYFIFQLRKTLQFKIDPIRILKFFIFSLVSFGTIFLFLENLSYDENLFSFIPELVPFIFVSFLIYFTLTFIFDTKTRSLVKTILKELKN